ncbi:T9SS type A sorting domain-containing protein [Salibacter halophilus]|uniref:T9SS type A sorting domain-containing protein n=1 Tax=Salibacter halophilus TaxID=1803916 RepID=A0A6N6MDM5_9FLAO|nr:T9SS type A sorting domain-containing protein [Salibacter halophilus]KAB1065679.1 T9SS type A sorting domain-containing protein [Salibacter halophilus]
MKKNKFKLIVTTVTGLLWVGLVHSQESVNVSGGNASGVGGSVAYSLGQVVFTTNVDTTGSVSQGVQQTYNINEVGVQETELNISLSVFPNPTDDKLILKINKYNNNKLSYQLYDMKGRLLMNDQIRTQRTQINTTSLPPALYFMNVVDRENREVQSFKIVKN